MRRIAALAAALLFLCLAPAAFAAAPKWEEASGATQTRRWVVSFGSADSGDSLPIPNRCNAWSGSFYAGSGGGGQVELYAVPDAATGSAGGTLLASWAATAAASTTFRTAHPFLVVKVAAAPASGTAKLWLGCSLDVGGVGADGSTPSLISGDYNGSPPPSCNVTNDVHLDRQTGALWWCTNAGANTFVGAARTWTAQFWSTTVTSAGDNNECMHSGTQGTSGACTLAGSATSAGSTWHVIYSTRTVVIWRQVCVATAAIDIADTESLELVPFWSDPNDAGDIVTTETSVGPLFENAAMDDLLDNAVEETIVVAPYTGAFGLSLRQKVTGTITSGAVSCTVFLAEF